MNRGKYIVLTNNPLVFDKLEKTHEVIYLETTYEGLLREVRDRIHDGHGRYGESVLEDFQLIDWTLLESGLASADAW